MTRRSRRRGPVRTHPYTPSGILPADHRGDRPCICGRAKGNAAHELKVSAEVEAAQAEHLRRIGEQNS